MKFPFSFWGLPAGTVIAKRTVTTDPHAAIKVATASTVDWGDGTPLENVAANAQLNHVYATTGEMTVTITAAAPIATNPNLSVKHPLATAVDAGWADIMIRDPQLVDFTVKPNSSLKTLHVLGRNEWKPHAPTNFNNMPDIEEIEIDSYLSSTTLQEMCSGNTKLKRFVCLTPAVGVRIEYVFQNCKSLESIQWDFSKNTQSSFAFYRAHLAFNPVLDLPETTNMENMFNSATGITSLVVTGARKATRVLSFLKDSSITSINRMDLDSVTNASAMCFGTNIVHHPGYIGELTQDVSYMFHKCPLLETIGDIGMANVTNTAQMLWYSPKIRSLTLRGLRVSVDVNNAKLDATALDAVFTSLGNANAGATINITGNPGTATCNKTIAVNKGWAVTG